MKPAEIGSHEQWFAPGTTVAVIEYLGRGDYTVERAIVARVTPAQIVTEDGRKFWRRKCGMSLVGQTDKRNGGMRVNPIRIAPINCTRAVRYFATHPTT